MPVETRSALPDVPRELPPAGREPERLLRRPEYGVRRRRPRIGTEILRLVGRSAPRDADLRVRVVHRYLYIRVGLRILQFYIILRRVLFNQAVLERQRLHLCVAEDIVEAADVRDHPPCLLAVRRGLMEILRDAVPQRPRLADIDDLVVPVAHYIHAGSERQGVRPLGERGAGLLGSGLQYRPFRSRRGLR